MSNEGNDDAGGNETLSPGQLHSVYSKYSRQLGSCARAAGVRHVTVSFSVDAKTGVPSSARANGEAGGGLASCLTGVVKQMRFPTVDGRRTNVSFPIDL